MKKYLTFIFLISFISIEAQDIRIPIDTSVTTNSEVLINNQKITYQAKTGMQPVWNDHGGNAIASSILHLLQKNQYNVNTAERPIAYVFQWWSGFCFCLDALRLYWSECFEILMTKAIQCTALRRAKSNPTLCV